jgi:hypothetical protein
MRHHLDALVVLHRIWGAFGVLTGTSLGVLALGADAALAQMGSFGRAEHAAVLLLALSGILLVALGAAAWLAARGLQRRRPTGRLVALALAIPNLVIVPFGTALGVYTIWALINDDARQAFGRPPRGSLTDPGDSAKAARRGDSAP